MIFVSCFLQSSGLAGAADIKKGMPMDNGKMKQ